MAREGNVIPFVPRAPKEPEMYGRSAFTRAFPEELFAYPHDPWFVEKIMESIRRERFAE
ncbi:hypothetical protein K2P56_03340 [Patescibacteria group bacterium]|nr:hypothetical protein [Patescibacteria group bacterium]